MLRSKPKDHSEENGAPQLGDRGAAWLQRSCKEMAPSDRFTRKKGGASEYKYPMTQWPIAAGRGFLSTPECWAGPPITKQAHLGPAGASSFQESVAPERVVWLTCAIILLWPAGCAYVTLYRPDLNLVNKTEMLSQIRTNIVLKNTKQPNTYS